MPDHGAYRDWLDAEVNSEAAFGLSDLVLSGFVRIVTHPRVFSGTNGVGRRPDLRLATPEPTESNWCCTRGSSLGDIRRVVCVRRGQGQSGSRMPTSRRWPSNTVASGSRPIGTTAGSRGSIGDILSVPERSLRAAHVSRRYSHGMRKRQRQSRGAVAVAQAMDGVWRLMPGPIGRSGLRLGCAPYRGREGIRRAV